MRRSVVNGIVSTAVAAALLVALWFVFVVPYPSLRRTAVVRNATGNDLGIGCTTTDGKHKLQVRLPPGESSQFVYFVGDRGGADGDTVRALILVTNVSTGERAERYLQLPIAPSRPTIQISNDWFGLGGPPSVGHELQLSSLLAKTAGRLP